MCLFLFIYLLTWLAEGRSLSRALCRNFLFVKFLWLLTVTKDLRVGERIARYPYQRIHEVAKIWSSEIWGCDLVFAPLPSLRTLNSIIFSLQPSCLQPLCPQWATPCLWAGSPGEHCSLSFFVRRLSLLLSRNLLGCLCCAVLVIQQMPRLVESPMRTGACKLEATCSCL